MSLPSEIGSHHTMWFTVGAHRPVAVRYVVDHDEVVCFGDGDLSELSEGDSVVGTVHDIAGGQPLVATKYAVRVLPSESVPLFVVGEVLGLNPAGSWEDVRSSRRFLSLRGPGSQHAA